MQRSTTPTLHQEYWFGWTRGLLFQTNSWLEGQSAPKIMAWLFDANQSPPKLWQWDQNADTHLNAPRCIQRTFYGSMNNLFAFLLRRAEGQANIKQTRRANTKSAVLKQKKNRNDKQIARQSDRTLKKRWKHAKLLTWHAYLFYKTFLLLP